MARLHTSFVLGYHGCSEEIGEKILSGELRFRESEEDYDWLGPGVYFWEADPLRAWEWADWRVQRGDIDKPFVLGSVIDLGNCLDLVSRESLSMLNASFIALKAAADASGGGDLPENRKGHSADEDNLRRFLDCAVVRHLHAAMKDQKLPGFDSVRGLFTEGRELFPGSGFRERTHVQIAVRNRECIKAVFREPREPS